MSGKARGRGMASRDVTCSVAPYPTRQTKMSFKL
jgi:hypothetical protein